ncbi:hypothetical protein EV202_1171, partial [Bacteroides heparinolyticus]
LTEIDAHGVRAAAEVGFLPPGMPEGKQEKQEEEGSFHCL